MLLVTVFVSCYNLKQVNPKRRISLDINLPGILPVISPVWLKRLGTQTMDSRFGMHFQALDSEDYRLFGAYLGTSIGSYSYFGAFRARFYIL